MPWQTTSLPSERMTWSTDFSEIRMSLLELVRSNEILMQCSEIETVVLFSWSVAVLLNIVISHAWNISRSPERINIVQANKFSVTLNRMSFSCLHLYLWFIQRENCCTHQISVKSIHCQKNIENDGKMWRPSTNLGTPRTKPVNLDLLCCLLLRRKLH